MKTCRACKAEKPETDFYRQRPGYLFSECKDCHGERRKRSRAAHPERWRAYQRDYSRRKLYGITTQTYEWACREQGGMCSICGETNPCGRSLSIDHCHRRDVIRGILCDRCNRGLGLFRDRPDLLRAAAAYLDEIEEVMPILLQNQSRRVKKGG